MPKRWISHSDEYKCYIDGRGSIGHVTHRADNTYYAFESYYGKARQFAANELQKAIDFVYADWITDGEQVIEQW